MGLSKLLPVGRNIIRRYHGTESKLVPNIAKEGLLVNSPNLNRDASQLHLSNYPGVYTTVRPDYHYFQPDNYGNALVVLDIPKDWYRQATRLPYNPELPNPPPKLKRWDETGRIKAEQEYKQLHPTEDANPYNLPEGWGDTPFDIFDTYRSIVPIQQGGRVDIFKQNIPKEFINEIIIPRGDDKYKTVIKPNRNVDWWNVDFFDDL